MNIAPLVVYAVLGLLVGMLRLLLEAPVLLTRYFLRKERGRKIYLVVLFYFSFFWNWVRKPGTPPNGAGGAGQSLLRLLNKEPVSSTVDFRNSRSRDILLGLAGTQNPDSEAVTAVTDLL